MKGGTIYIVVASPNYDTIVIHLKAFQLHNI